MMKTCGNCWWKPVCKQTKKACAIIQTIDMCWENCPNNRQDIKTKGD